MNKKGVLIAGVPSRLSPTPLPFSLFPYPLPLSTRVAKGKKEDLIHLLHELSANNQSDNTDFVTSVSLLGGVHSFVGS